MKRALHRPVSDLVRASIVAVVVSLAVAAAPSTAGATIFPRNDLWKQDNPLVVSAITQQQFNAVLDLIELRYRPVFFFFNANLVVNRFWNDSTVNAFARRSGSDWIIDMYGGLARRPEITADGFLVVACHEIGHHLGGYYFYPDNWAASEGEADNYAVQACARYIWRSDPANAEIAATAPQSVRDRCHDAWSTDADRNLCARIALAGKGLADVSGAIDGTGTSDFDATDSHVVTQTRVSHPAAQCRLDTYIEGAQCGVFFNFDIIPGINDPIGQNSVHAEIAAAGTSCMPASALVGAPGYNGHDRPRCWFAPQLQ